MSRDQQTRFPNRCFGATLFGALSFAALAASLASFSAKANGPVDPAPATVILAARGNVEPAPFQDREDSQDRQLVKQTQKSLADLGLYFGAIDGRLNNNLTSAIRLFQQQAGLKITGRISDQLLAHLERSVKVSALLRGLDTSRNKAMDAARQALLAHPATRDLLQDQTVEPADATRDPSKCFDEPTVRCLLAEAFESAKAIVKRDLRDWAMGEILTAQARAGLLKLAMETTRRIQDPRLMMVALKDIAAAQARAGREEDALAAAEIIPDSRAQVQALADIAEIQSQHGYFQAAQNTAALLFAMARHLRVPTDQVTYATRAAVILYQSSDRNTANEAMDLAWSVAENTVPKNAKATAWRQIADAMAQLDRVNAALALVQEVTRESDRAAVLIATARAAIRADDLSMARKLADDVDAARYRALVLGQIAVAKARAGDSAGAEKIIDAAFDDAEAVALPFARSYAISRLVLALSDMARVPGASKDELVARFVRARNAANGIKDARLRAQVLFRITAWQRRTHVPEADVNETEKQAHAAAGQIASAIGRVWVYGDAATMHARAEESVQAWKAFDRGMAEARKIDQSLARARSLAKMAQTLIDLVVPKTAEAQEIDTDFGPEKTEGKAP